MKKLPTTIIAMAAGLALAVGSGVLPASAAVAVTKSYGAKNCATLYVSLEAQTMWYGSYVRNNGTPITYSDGATWAYHRNVALHSVSSATVTSSGGPLNGVKNWYAGCAL